MSPGRKPSTPPSKLKRTAKWAMRLFSLVSLIALLLALRAWWLVESTPDYYFPPNPPTEQVADRAAAFEQWLPSQFSKQRPYDQPWQIEIEVEDVNEWLAARFEKWALNQGWGMPEGLGGVMFTLQDDRMLAAGQIDQDGQQRVVSVAFKAHNGAPGEVAELRMDALYLGKLKVPLETVLDLGEKVADPQRVRDIREVHEQVKTIPLSFELDRIRLLEITNVAPQETKVTLTCRTVRR